MPRLTFWFEFASTYSYLTAMRIEDKARDAGVDVVWRPILLGPIFGKQGLTTSPFIENPIKGRYMVRDVERLASDQGLAFKLSSFFPVNSLLAARLALVGLDEAWGRSFCRAVYHAQFALGQDISQPACLETILKELDVEPEPVLAAAIAPENKKRLKDQTEEAFSLGVFGAPSFTTEQGDLFWGDDRLDQAFLYAARER